MIGRENVYEFEAGKVFTHDGPLSEQEIENLRSHGGDPIGFASELTAMTQDGFRYDYVPYPFEHAHHALKTIRALCADPKIDDETAHRMLQSVSIAKAALRDIEDMFDKLEDEEAL